MVGFSDKDLAVLYERALDLDSLLLNLAFEQCNQQNYLTEAFTLIYMVSVEPLKLTAMTHFIRVNELLDMLLEDETRFTLDFEINKDITLRQFLGPDCFKRLIKRTVAIVGEQDRETCICLLDKIKATKEVLETLIALQMSQIEQSKPLRFVSPEDSHNHETQYRVFDTELATKERRRAALTFRTLLNNYRKEGLGQQFAQLF